MEKRLFGTIFRYISLEFKNEREKFVSQKILCVLFLGRNHGMEKKGIFIVSHI